MYILSRAEYVLCYAPGDVSRRNSYSYRYTVPRTAHTGSSQYGTLKVYFILTHTDFGTNYTDFGTALSLCQTKPPCGLTLALHGIAIARGIQCACMKRIFVTSVIV